MTLILKQSTAIDIRMGPFVDATDGVTPETGVSLGSADQAEVLKANGAATVAMGGAFAAVTDCGGWYDYTIVAGEVDTVGEVVFVVQDSSLCLPVFTRATVVEENVYVAWYAASAAAGTDLASILTDTETTLNDKLDTIDDFLDTEIAAITTAVITAAAGANIAVDIIALKAETASILTDTSSTLDTKLNTIDGIVDDILVDTAAIAGITTAVVTGAAGAHIAADIIAIKTETALIVEDTGTTLQDELDGIQADTEDIQTRLPAALSGGNMKADVLAISTSAAAANNLEESAEVILSGTASGTPTTTAMVSDIGVTVNDQFVGRTIIFKNDTSTAALQNQATDITACTASSDTLTFTALTTAPASGDTFVIV